MTKSRLSAIPAVFTLFLGLFILAAPSHSVAKTYKLTFTHPWPAVHPQHKDVLVPWAKKIEEETNGQVEIKFMVAGAMAKAGQTYSMIQKGIADIGWGICDYTPGRFPLTSVVTLPYMTKTGEKSGEVLWKLYEKIPAFQEEYGDTKLLGLSSFSPGIVATRETPIKTYKDLDGLKIKTANWITNEALTTFGAVPVTMTIDDTYTALERGVLDGVITTSTALLVFKLDGLVNHMTQIDFYRTVFFITMNTKKYNSLPDDIKEVIDRNSGLVLSKKLGKSFGDTDVGSDKVMADKGAPRVFLSKEEEEELKDKLAVKINNKWVEEMNEKGLPGQLVLDTAVSLIAE
jgi:TRAP-type C4-dicarboxylate transport system substrate-binding protein